MSVSTSDWDPLSPSNVFDPHAEQRRMRQKCPIAFTEQFGGVWAAFKHNDLEQISADPETFCAAEAFVVPDMTGGVFPWLPLQSDPPLHSHYRGLIAPFFKRSRLAQFEPDLVQITHDHIDAFIDAGTADVASQLNFPVAASALALLMGLPAEEGATFKRWHYAMVAANAAEDQQALGETFIEILSYVSNWMDVRKADPTDDLMSALVQGTIEGCPLTNEEILGTFILLVVGGFETTADTLSSTMQYLSGDPALCDRLREDPKLMTKAVGEFARAFAPVQATARTAVRGVIVGGRDIASGERILMMWASGSHDEDVFPNPEVVDIDRPGTHKMTSFGAGAHRCAGEPLARIEMRAVLNTWLQRIDTFKVDGEPEHSVWPTLGWHVMAVSFTPRSATG